MGETGGLIHPKAKFFSSWEPGKPDRCVLTVYGGETGTVQVFALKGRDWEEDRRTGLKQAQP